MTMAPLLESSRMIRSEVLEVFRSFAIFEVCCSWMLGSSGVRLRLRFMPIPLVAVAPFVPFVPFVSLLVGAAAFGFRATSIF